MSEEPRPSFVRHVLTMPFHHKVLCLLAVALVGVGVTGQNLSSSPNSSAPQGASSPSPSAGSSGFVSDTSQQPTQPQPQGQPQNPLPQWAQNISPHMWQVGSTFLICFVVGWLFRTFLRLTSMLLMLAMGIWLALSYFGVLNVDFSKAEQEYQTAMAWATDQSCA